MDEELNGDFLDPGSTPGYSKRRKKMGRKRRFDTLPAMDAVQDWDKFPMPDGLEEYIEAVDDSDLPDGAWWMILEEAVTTHTSC